jgi:RNA polymerase sigma-70 factor, ECF subfamily
MSTLEIWNSYRLQLFNFIRRQVPDRATAKDILQDVFVKAQLRRHEIRDLTKVGAWMFSITRNAISDYYRKNKNVKAIADPAEVISEESHIVDAYNQCVAFCLNKLIHTLPEQYKQALIKTEIEGIPQTLLSEQLGISFSGAKSRVQRGRKMLKEKLMELYEIKTDAYGNIIVCEDKSPCACTPDIFCD